MGIEYSVTTDKFDKDRFDTLLGKVLSASMDYVKIISPENIEIKFDEEQSMPDAIINVQENGVTFTYNGGYHHSWAVFGLLVAYMAERFSSVNVKEL
jgi:hypothetical protein